jgi:ribosomal-protein-alanine N-acetyltransferase
VLNRPINTCTLSLGDLDTLVNFDRLCFGGHWSRDNYAREIDSENSHFQVIKTTPDLAPKTQGVIAVGCFWAILDEAHITLIGIHPEYQGQGLGKLLLYQVLDKARIENMARATLEVRKSNQRAINLYEKFGFQTAGIRKKYYQDTDEDALIMWRNRLQYPEFNHNLHQWKRAIDGHLQQAGWINQ